MSISPDEIARYVALAQHNPSALTSAGWTRVLWSAAELAAEPGESIPAALQRIASTTATGRVLWAASRSHALASAAGRPRLRVPYDVIEVYWRLLADAFAIEGTTLDDAIESKAPPPRISCLKRAIRARYPTVVQPALIAKRLIRFYEASDLLLDPALPDSEVAARISERTRAEMTATDVGAWRRAAKKDGKIMCPDDLAA
ncbi:hypothetical protein [Roseospirillum parvum]|uniref:Uncharacterized protein n=1 Tax=Roseospirillum parvum TaxID=83401 RepID=A0A1G8E736_9PROT|nr:hypothetical protein [Roseospirillum parvum]SDH65459.1 hypothetical protein SAMN05421742_10950 [Roseospirillum parvum]